VEDIDESQIDPHDWIVRVQMVALVTMYKAIPQAIKADLARLSDPETGLFRKEKEVKAIMDAAELVMKQRGGDLKGIVPKSGDAKDIFALIKAAIKNDDLHYEPAWDKRWATNKAFGIMTTGQTNIKIVKLVKTKKGQEGEPNVSEECTFTKRADFAAVLPSEDDASAELASTTFEFHFLRLTELEDQPLERLKKNDASGWHVHDTQMSSFLGAMGMNGEEIMTTLCGGDKSEPFVQQFIKCRDIVEDDAIKHLKAKVEALKRDADLTVDPSPGKWIAPGIRKYHQDKDNGVQVTIKQIGQLKRDNQATIQDYEKVVDNMKDYLEQVSTKFNWSRRVRAEVQQVKRNVKDDMIKLRKKVGDFWNEQEGMVTKKAKEQESAAQAAEEEARKKEQDACQRQAEALKAQQLAQDAEDKARKEKDTAVAEQIRAAAALEIAKNEIRNALQERDRAREELILGAQMLQAAEDSKMQAAEQAKAAVQREHQAKAAEEKASARIKELEQKEAEMRKCYECAKEENKDVSWIDRWFI
jgi:hypothetical protein